MTFAITIIKGVLIGVSFLIPGLSGGTMMLILNVFDDAVHALNELLHFRAYRLKYYLVMTLGIGLGILAFAGVIDYLLINFNTLTMSFFLGVILSGLIEIDKQITNKVKSIKSLIPYLIGILLTAGVYFLPSLTIQVDANLSLQNWLQLIIIGIPISVALILPGLSTSYLLLVFGLYERTLRAISTLDFMFLLPLIIGILIGVVLFTTLIDSALQNYPNLIYKIIYGLVLGSVYGIVKELGIQSLPEGMIAIGVAIIGFVCVMRFKKTALKLEEASEM
ncbi:DUF368 domain-containing protein [Erysipelothrix sp. HDW6B]|uniref:DUF368 domain-containing protein n=1 Tax=Erysipelothrix sp. HDW6B TaxID=2714929 RepID=UPI00140E5C22|nr:DUF368 domain-containing protein [Erysipelothrix sp. HDW6B]QIK86553.1 DUF368 domain-containing protein [Erysipelothrix sp. HDW6B]